MALGSSAAHAQLRNYRPHCCERLTRGCQIGRFIQGFQITLVLIRCKMETFLYMWSLVIFFWIGRNLSLIYVEIINMFNPTWQPWWGRGTMIVYSRWVWTADCFVCHVFVFFINTPGSLEPSLKQKQSSLLSFVQQGIFLMLPDHCLFKGALVDFFFKFLICVRRTW